MSDQPRPKAISTLTYTYAKSRYANTSGEGRRASGHAADVPAIEQKREHESRRLEEIVVAHLPYEASYPLDAILRGDFPPSLTTKETIDPTTGRLLPPKGRPSVTVPTFLKESGWSRSTVVNELNRSKRFMFKLIEGRKYIALKKEKRQNEGGQASTSGTPSRPLGSASPSPSPSLSRNRPQNVSPIRPSMSTSTNGHASLASGYRSSRPTTSTSLSISTTAPLFASRDSPLPPSPPGSPSAIRLASPAEDAEYEDHATQSASLYDQAQITDSDSSSDGEGGRKRKRTVSVPLTSRELTLDELAAMNLRERDGMVLNVTTEDRLNERRRESLNALGGSAKGKEREVEMDGAEAQRRREYPVQGSKNGQTVDGSSEAGGSLFSGSDGEGPHIDDYAMEEPPDIAARINMEHRDSGSRPPSHKVPVDASIVEAGHAFPPMPAPEKSSGTVQQTALHAQNGFMDDHMEIDHTFDMPSETNGTTSVDGREKRKHDAVSRTLHLGHPSPNGAPSGRDDNDAQDEAEVADLLISQQPTITANARVRQSLSPEKRYPDDGNSTQDVLLAAEAAEAAAAVASVTAPLLMDGYQAKRRGTVSKVLPDSTEEESGASRETSEASGDQQRDDADEEGDTTLRPEDLTMGDDSQDRAPDEPRKIKKKQSAHARKTMPAKNGDSRQGSKRLPSVISIGSSVEGETSSQTHQRPKRDRTSSSRPLERRNSAKGRAISVGDSDLYPQSDDSSSESASSSDEVIKVTTVRASGPSGGSASRSASSSREREAEVQRAEYLARKARRAERELAKEAKKAALALEEEREKEREERRIREKRQERELRKKEKRKKPLPTHRFTREEEREETERAYRQRIRREALGRDDEIIDLENLDGYDAANLQQAQPIVPLTSRQKHFTSAWKQVLSYEPSRKEQQTGLRRPDYNTCAFYPYNLPFPDRREGEAIVAIAGGCTVRCLRLSSTRGISELWNATDESSNWQKEDDHETFWSAKWTHERRDPRDKEAKSAVWNKWPLLILAGQSKEVKILDGYTGTTLKIMQGHGGSVTSLAVHPQLPHIIATGSSDETLSLWDISVPVPKPEILGPKVVNIHENEKRRKGYVEGERLAVFGGMGGHVESVLSVAFHPCLPLLLSGGVDTKLRIWRLPDDIPLQPTSSLMKPVTAPPPKVSRRPPNIAFPIWTQSTLHSHHIDHVQFIGNEGDILTRSMTFDAPGKRVIRLFRPTFFFTINDPSATAKDIIGTGVDFPCQDVEMLRRWTVPLASDCIGDGVLSTTVEITPGTLEARRMIYMPTTEPAIQIFDLSARQSEEELESLKRKYPIKLGEQILQDGVLESDEQQSPNGSSAAVKKYGYLRSVTVQEGGDGWICAVGECEKLAVWTRKEKVDLGPLRGQLALELQLVDRSPSPLLETAANGAAEEAQASVASPPPSMVNGGMTNGYHYMEDERSPSVEYVTM